MIDLADFIEPLLHLGVSGHTLAGLVELGCGFEQERLHLAFGEAAVQIIEGAVFGAGGGVAVAVGFAACEETLDEGGVEELWGELKGAQQMRLALAQGEGGSAPV